MIFLFTDFGAADLYVGQVKAVLAERAPRVPVIDLVHDAPPFNARASAHLLAALAARLPRGSVTLAVVDPGVGGARDAVAVRADERWFVGPDDGLLSVAAARARRRAVFTIGWRPRRLSESFHARDLFAPVAAMLARGRRRQARLARKAALDVDFGAGDLAEVIYADRFGNLVTGLRAGSVARDRRLAAGGREIGYARAFCEVPPGELFWYENSLGLVEIAAGAASAAARLGLGVGDAVGFAPAGGKGGEENGWRERVHGLPTAR